MSRRIIRYYEAVAVVVAVAVAGWKGGLNHVVVVVVVVPGLIVAFIVGFGLVRVLASMLIDWRRHDACL